MKTVPLALFFLGAFCLTGPAHAAIVPLDFSAQINTGTLAGTSFQGTVAYDTSGLTGVGTESSTLTAIAFDLDGVPFTRSDITQGGQMISLDGAPEYFTASFFPAPAGSPVADITFGFGGPGIIGTYNYADDFGAGTYVLRAASVPEPMTILLMSAGLAGMLAVRGRKLQV